MLLWVDDLRPAPEGWTHARSVNDAITHLATGEVTHTSLDHDLGDYASDGGDATALTDWMAEHAIWPTDGIAVHSANPVGVATMLATIDTYAPYPGGYGTRRGTWPAQVTSTLRRRT